MRELQDRMGSREFAEWVARANIKAEEAKQQEMIRRVESRMASKR